MTMTTPRGPESTVLRMVGNAMHIQNIEVETGWTPDEIKAVAMRNGYALDAASKRFRRAPQPKPAPVGIVRTQVTTPCPHRSWESLDGITHCMDCGHSVEVTVDDADDAEAARVLGTSQTSTGAERPSPSPVPASASDRSSAPVLPDPGAVVKPVPEDPGSAALAPASTTASDPFAVAGAAFAELLRAIALALDADPAVPVAHVAAPKPAPQPRVTHGATQSQIRDWARSRGLDVNPRGTVRRDIAEAYAAAHPQETP